MAGAKPYSGEVIQASASPYTGGITPLESGVSNDLKISVPEMLVRAGYNLPSSASNFVGSIYQAVRHPIQTASTVSDLGAGIVMSAMPESWLESLGPTGLRVLFGERNKEMKDMAQEVGKYYVNRYGSVDKFKLAFAEDPVGILSDVSSVFGAGAALAPAKIAPKLQAVANVIDPVNAAGWALSKTGGALGTATTGILGTTTGAGQQPIREAYAAGREGGQRAAQFSGQMRGTRSLTEPLDIAKRNLDAIRQQRSDQYRSGMIDITNDKSVLEFGDIDKAIESAYSSVTFKDKPTNNLAVNKLAEAKAYIDDWKALDPAEYHTPEGMDALKRQVNSILEDIPYANAQARRAVGGVHDAVKKTITTQAPTYANVMSDYSNMSDLISEVEKSLSLNPNASVDTTMRKLQSIMRNNANTNYGQRLGVAQQMQQMGGESFMPALAGQSLSQAMPRGIQGGVAGITSLGGYTLGGLPGAVAAGVMQSPRAMGELAYGTGAMVRKADQATKYIDPRIQRMMTDPLTRNLLYQAGNIDQEQQ